MIRDNMLHRSPCLRMVAFALCAAFVLTTGCMSREERLAAHLQAADQYAEDGRDREALIELRSALKLDPKSADVNYKIAEFSRERRRFQDALFYYLEAYRLDPDRVEAGLAAIPILLRNRDGTDRAEELVLELVAKYPANAMVHIRRSMVAMRQNDREAALHSALTAVELAPSLPGAYMQVGRVHIQNMLEAEDEEQSPQTLDTAELEAAYAAFQRAGELYEEDEKLQAEMQAVRVLASWPGREQDARAAFLVLLDRAKTARARDQRQAISMAMRFARRHRDEALLRGSIEQLLELDDSNMSAWAELARIEEIEGGSASSVFDTMLERRGDDPEAHAFYAAYLANKGEPDQAVAHLEKAIDDGIAPEFLLWRLVELQYQLGHDAEGSKYVDRLQEAPYAESTEARLALAYRDLKEGRNLEGVDLLRRLVGEQETVEVQHRLALAELQVGNLRAARTAIDRAIELYGSYSPALLRAKATIEHFSRDWRATLRTLRLLEQGGTPLTLEQRTMRARSLYKLDRPEAGRRVLEAVLEDPDAEVRSYLTYHQEERERNPERAKEMLLKALKKDPSDSRVLQRLARQYVREGNVDEGLMLLTRAIDSGSADKVVYRTRANLYAGLGRLPEAESDARVVLDLDPSDAGAVELLVRLYSVQQKVPEAIEELETQRKAGAATPNQLVVLGRLYLQTGNEQQARFAFEAAIEAAPDMVGVKNDLAYLLARNGMDLDRALRLAQDAQQGMAENPIVADTLGYVYLRKGLAEPALRQFEYAIALWERGGESNAGFYYHLGLALKALDRNSEAVTAFQRCLEISPDFPDAENVRRELDAAQGLVGESSSSG